MQARDKTKPAFKSDDEHRFLKKIGRHVHKRLSELDKPVEWLSWESETSRATVRRIFDGDRNIGILTLDRVSRALGYKNGIAGLLNDL